MSDDFGPYVGPRPYERRDGARFFGRDEEQRDLLSLVVSEQVVLLYAASGAGKTSLLEAGLIPLLQQRHDFEVLEVARVRERTDEPPVGRNVFMHGFMAKWPELDVTGGRLADALALMPHASARDGFDAPRALVFDQFEEIFSVYPERWEEREGFFTELDAALDKNPLLRVVIAIREDRIASLEPYAPFVRGELEAAFRLPLLGADAAEEAVEGPLIATSRRFEEGVPRRLVMDLRTHEIDLGARRESPITIVGEYVEPVHLQVACAALWRGLPDDVQVISDEHVSEFGDVDEALADFYDDAIRAAAAAVGMSERRLRQHFAETFITPIGTRGTVVLGDGAAGRLPQRAIEELEGRHVIRAEWRANARWYELTHDRLIEPVKAANEREQLLFATDMEAQPRIEDAREPLEPEELKHRRPAWTARLFPRRTAPPQAPVVVDEEETAGTALCLSGSGYRAMLFDVGSLLRLNEAGWLPRIERFVGTSGGAIAAGMLGLAWSQLEWDGDTAANLDEEVVAPLRHLAGVTVDVRAMLHRLIRRTATTRWIDNLEECLYGDATLMALPDSPEFVFTASHLGSGQPFRFSRRITGNPKLGVVSHAPLRVAEAIGAASAVPPLLSPTVVKVRGLETDEVALTDGALQDSLAVETVWRRFATVLICDGKGWRPGSFQSRPTNVLQHLAEMFDAADGEVRALRRRQVVTGFVSGLKQGAYWSVASDLRSFGIDETLPYDRRYPYRMVNIGARLAAMDPDDQERVINWGYAVADAALRGYVDPTTEAPLGMPYPDRAIV